MNANAKIEAAGTVNRLAVIRAFSFLTWNAKTRRKLLNRRRRPVDSPVQGRVPYGTACPCALRDTLGGLGAVGVQSGQPCAGDQPGVDFHQVRHLLTRWSRMGDLRRAQRQRIGGVSG